MNHRLTLQECGFAQRFSGQPHVATKSHALVLVYGGINKLAREVLNQCDAMAGARVRRMVGSITKTLRTIGSPRNSNRGNADER